MLLNLLNFRLISVLAFAFASSLMYAQSPTMPAQNFNVFTSGNATLITNESEGPVAIGGDLTVNGNYQVAIHSGGTFLVNNVKIGLLVNGKVNYQGGNSLQVNSNSYVKIGNPVGSTVWYTDPNNATPPIRITPNSNYNSSSKIMLQANAPTLGVSANNNPVFQSNLLDFAAAFQTMRTSSLSIAQCTSNVQLTRPNGQSIPSTNLPNHVRINMQNGINYWDISAADLNAVQVLTFDNKPSASKVLVINVNAAGTFNWNVWNQAGINFAEAPFIIYNFHNTTQLNINNGATTVGTVFAPFADIFKGSGNQSNIQGQVIAKSFIHSGGEVHYAVFSPTVAGCAAPPVAVIAPTANFSTPNATQCLGTNSFTFTNTSTPTTAAQPSAPLSYVWDFGDGTTSTLMSPTKVYATAGTYTVTLTTTNTIGVDIKTQQVVVNPATNAVVNQTTSATGSGAITKQLILTNSSDFTNYSWAVSNGGSGLFANQSTVTFTFTQAGSYQVTLTSTNTNGCQTTTVIPITIASGDLNIAPTANFSTPNTTQCLGTNSFVFTNTSGTFQCSNAASMEAFASVAAVESQFNGLYFSAEGRSGNNALNGTFEADIHHISPYTIKSQADFVWPNNQDVPFNIVYNPNASGNDKFVYTIGTGLTQKIMKFDPTTENYPLDINAIWFYSRTAANTTLLVSDLVVENNTVAGALGAQNPSNDTFTNVLFRNTNFDNGFTVSGKVKFGWTVAIPQNSSMNWNFKIGNVTCTPTTISQPSAPLSYVWDFGDGTTSTLMSPTKVYAAAGTYTVTLTTTNTIGVDVKTQQVVVNPATNAVVNQSTSATGSGSITKQLVLANSVDFANYSWAVSNGGSGLFANQSTVTFTFTQAGNYQVTLTSTEANGCQTSTVIPISIACIDLNTGHGQSPTTPARKFNVFTLGNSTLQTNESDGPVAIGGDLTIDGNYQVAIHSAGTFLVDNVKIGLLVNGKVNYQGGNSLQVNSNGYVKIGNPVGSTVWYADPNNATPPIRITPSPNYNSSPKIMLQANAPSLGVSVINNPVFQSNLVDFSAAFQTMEASSLIISQSTSNVQLTDPNAQSIPLTNLPNQVKINMQNGINYWNISAADLNAVQVLTFNNQPSASKVLVINVNAAGNFNWNVWNQAGIGITEAPFIIYNFYNTTQLNINNGATTVGTVFAPFADVFKGAGNQSNIQGQVIAKSFIHSGGKVHYAIFLPTLTGCAAPPVTGSAPTSNFSTPNATQCLGTNSFTFTNTSAPTAFSQPSAPITYLWDFGDGTTSTSMNPTKVYAASGTYTVKLTSTNIFGVDDETQEVVVSTRTNAVVSQSTSAIGLTYIVKQLVLTNSLDFANYSWAVSNGASGLFPNQSTVNFTFTQAGYYEITLTATDANGCQTTTIIPIIIASNDVNSGNAGAIESESLGDIMSRQYVSRKMKSIPTEFVKSQATRFDKKTLVTAENLQKGINGRDLTMTEMFPTSLQNGDVADITSPTDILNFTIAQEVLSVDFSVQGVTKAVVLGVRTKDRVYNHTKASCDRLRGAEILNVKTVKIGGYNFLMQAIKQRNGVTEYAVSFAVGKNHGHSFYTLQTNWFVNEYAPSKDVFNFQVWATLPEQTTKLVNDILNNLKASIPVLQAEIQKVPKTYAAKVTREGTELVLKLRSVAKEQSIEITMDQNYSETNGFTHRYNPLKSEMVQTIRLSVADSYEFDGLIRVEGDIQDAFYHADGNWGLDYDPTYTLINRYTVSNNFDRIHEEDELEINRNVNLEVFSDNDYATLYKSLLPGQIPADYNEYTFVSFRAKGSGLLELGLIKSSVENWKHQYRAVINVGREEQTYYVPFKFFTSSKSTQKINADDLTMLTFTFLPVEAKTKNLNLTIQDVKFTNKAPDGYEALLHTMQNEFMIYPNPSRGNVNCLLYSDAETTAKAILYDVSGKAIYSADVQLKEGKNELDFNFNVPTGVMFFSIKSEKVNYGTSKIFFK
jgi:choice-of-anchor A domain-containing protein